MPLYSSLPLSKSNLSSILKIARSASPPSKQNEQFIPSFKPRPVGSKMLILSRINAPKPLNNNNLHTNLATISSTGFQVESKPDLEKSTSNMVQVLPELKPSNTNQIPQFQSEPHLENVKYSNKPEKSSAEEGDTAAASNQSINKQINKPLSTESLPTFSVRSYSEHALDQSGSIPEASRLEAGDKDSEGQPPSEEHQPYHIIFPEILPSFQQVCPMPCFCQALVPPNLNGCVKIRNDQWWKARSMSCRKCFVVPLAPRNRRSTSAQNFDFHIIRNDMMGMENSDGDKASLDSGELSNICSEDVFPKDALVCPCIPRPRPCCDPQSIRSSNRRKLSDFTSFQDEEDEFLRQIHKLYNATANDDELFENRDKFIRESVSEISNNIMMTMTKSVLE